MSSIDERVVEMKFDTSAFQRGVQVTLDGLAKLKDKLQFKGGGKGLEEVEAKANKISFKGVESGLQSLTDKFKTMSLVGITAVTNLTNKVVDAGLNMGKALSISPIMDGFSEYELKMGSIQTILANTRNDGTKLKDVSNALNELNKYADKTIYNFGDMTANIGRFTNAGIKLQPAVNMIKGFSNEAAASGTKSEEAGRAAYQLSQAMQKGKVSLEDWRSLTNVGMGNAMMQQDLVKIASAMDTFSGKGITAKQAQKGFNDSLEKGWLTADVMGKYLEIMSKDFAHMTKKQVEAERVSLRKLGLDEKEISNLIAKQKVAQEAAQKVRTATQLFGTLKEAIGSGWAETFELILGNFDEATDSFTKLSDLFGGVAQASATSRNNMLKDWKKNGGMTALADSMVAAFEALQAALKPIKDAFHEIFPPMTGKQLANMTIALKEFLQGLKMGPETAAKVKAAFKGLFAIFSIGLTIGKKIWHLFVDLWQTLTEGSGPFQDLILKVSAWLVGVDKALKSGKGLNDFFRGLTTVLTAPIKFFQAFGRVIMDIFSGKGMSSKPITDALDAIKNRINPLKGSSEKLKQAWEGVKKMFSGIATFFAPFALALKDAWSKLFQSIKDGIATQDYSQILDTISTGLLGGLVLMFRKFFKNFDGSIGLDLGGGMLSKIGDSFEGLTGTLESMQTKLKADALFKIAAAVAVLAGSIVIMSLIPSDKLAQATGAVVGLFAGLMLAMKYMDQMSSFKGAVKLPLLAVGIAAMAVGILILSVAAKNLADLSWEELAKGLTGVVGLLLAVGGAVKLMSGSTKGMITAGIGITAMAIGIKILVSAVKDFASMDWGAMAKGLTGVASLLVALGLFTKLADANKMSISNGVALILLAASLKILYSVVKDFAGMSWEAMGKGMAGMAGALGLIAGAMQLMPKNMLVSAAALVVVAGSLVILSGALKTMGGMSWEAIAKGLVTLAGSLAIIAGAMYLMSGALPGAAALLIVCASLAILTPILQVLGGMDIVTIATALGVLAGVFALLGVAGLVLAPVVLPLMGLGAAIMLLGAGAALAGLGLLAFSAGLTALSIAGTAGAAALTAIAAAIIGLIPMALQAVGEGLVLLAGVLVNAAPQFLVAMVVLMTTLLNAITIMAPRIIDTLLGLIMMLLNKLVVAVPKFVDAGMKILIGFLNGIGNNIGKVVDAAVKIIVNLLNGITKNLPKIIKAGTDLIKKFLDGIAKAVPDVVDAGMKMITDILNGVADAIRANSKQMSDAGMNVASAIVDGLVNGLRDMGGRIIEKAKSLASDALNAFKSIFDVHSPSREMYKIGKYVVEGFVLGLDGNKSQIQTAFESMKSQLTDMRKHAEAEVKKQQAALVKLQKKPKTKANKKAIKDTKAKLTQARKENTQATNAYNNLTKNWTDDKNKLGQLADKYDVYAQKIKDANQKLVDAKKLRDDYATSVKEQYNNVPDIAKETKLQDFANDIRKKIEDNKAVLNKMTALRKLGLNDTLYKELIAKGADAIPFMDELLGTGKSGVDQINKLSGDLDKTAVDLGKSAAHSLYDAGVFAAQGIVNGLVKEQKNIEKQMDVIAAAMVKSIKKSLGIKSPAREMMPVGEFAAKGVAAGLKDFGYLAEEASAQVGVDTINAMRKSIVGLDEIVNGGNMDLTPTVRPVLDLTDIKSKAAAMDRLMLGSKVSATATYGQAKGASVGYSENQRAYAIAPEAPVAGKQINFTQINNSPKALGAAEVYRQTNNQLSRLKGALGK